MRISDWSSDVCSSDLPSTSTRPPDGPDRDGCPQMQRFEAMTGKRFAMVSLAAAMLALSACEGVETGSATPQETDELKRVREDSGKLFGDIELLGPGDSEAETSGIEIGRAHV